MLIVKEGWASRLALKWINFPGSQRQGSSALVWWDALLYRVTRPKRLQPCRTTRKYNPNSVGDFCRRQARVWDVTPPYFIPPEKQALRMRAIDYRCAEGRFSLSASGVTILNSPSLSSSKTEVRNGIKSWKARLLLSAERQEAMGGL
jgi:hypothetical protein